MFSERLFYGLLIILPLVSMPLSYGDYVPPPWQQTAMGQYQLTSVVCYDGLILIQELASGHLDCVKSQTASVLVKRNWAKVLPSVDAHKLSIVAEATQKNPSYRSVLLSLQKILDGCTYANVQLSYGLGGEHFSLNKTDTLCQVSGSFDIEQGENDFHCSVPLEKMKNATITFTYDINPFPDNSTSDFCSFKSYSAVPFTNK